MSKAMPSGPSGQHQSPRRKLSAPPEVWSLWDSAAEAAGVSFVKWAQRELSVAASRALGIDEADALDALEE